MNPLVWSEDPSGTGQGAHRSGEREALPDRLSQGTLISTPYDGGRAVESQTLCCIHCGYTWIPRPGSGRTRGFCTRCNGFVCGRKFCVEAIGCVHREQQLENIAAGRPLNFKPIIG